MPAIPTAPRNGTHQKENGSSGHTEQGSYQEALQRPLHQFKIIQPHRKPHAHDRPHQRRDEHGTDNHGCGVYIQSQRGHEYGEYQNPKIGSFEFHSLTDGIYSFQFIVLVFTQIKIVFQKSLDSEGISVVRIHDIYNLTIYYSVVYFFINQLMTGMLPRGISRRTI